MQQPSRLIPLALLGLIAGLSLWAILFRDDGRTDPGIASTGGGNPSDLAAQYRELDERLDRIERLLGTRPPAVPAESGPAASTGDPLIPSEEQTRLQATRRQARLQALFVSDPRATDSPKWESVINQAFSDPNVADVAQPSTRAAHCKMRVCQVTAQFAPGVDGSEWATRVSMALAAGFSSSRLAWETLPSGETELTMYAFRKGAEAILADQGI